MLSLEQLSSRWLLPEREQEFALPAITNFRGSLQAAWGVSGIQHWCAPTMSVAGATAQLYHEQKGGWRRFPRTALYQWRAYELLRRGHGVSSATRLGARRALCMQRLHFDRPGRYALVFDGSPLPAGRDTARPSTPSPAPVRRWEDGFLIEDEHSRARVCVRVPGTLELFSDREAFLCGEEPGPSGAVGVAVFDAEAGADLAWCAVQGTQSELPALEQDDDWAGAQRAWEQVWRDAFQHGGAHLSGRLPEEAGPLPRLYAMSVLSLLQCRRLRTDPALPSGGLERVYLGSGPEGEPPLLEAREIELQAPLLARLDPHALRAQLDALLALDPELHRGLDLASGAPVGPGSKVHAPALLSAIADYVTHTGDEDFALERLGRIEALAHERFAPYGHSLPCVPHWQHGVVAYNALMFKGLRFLAALTEERRWSRAAQRMGRDVLDHFAGGPFACTQADGERHVVRGVHDFAYVGRELGQDVPPFVRRQMLDFALTELFTEDWLRALSPEDVDAHAADLPSAQRARADHQSAGSSPAWAAWAASVLARFGERERAEAWLRRAQEVTREGPLGQAYALHAHGVRKAHPAQGGRAWSAAGAAFAAVLLEDWA